MHSSRESAPHLSKQSHPFEPLGAGSHEDKAELMGRALVEMRRHLTMPEWSAIEKVALTGRILSANGHESSLSGQVTARVAGTPYFVTQKLGVTFDEFSPETLLKIDASLNVVEGRGMPSPVLRFHAGIYDRRPEVACVIHTHAYHTSALSMLERPLEIAHMDCCALYDDVAFLEEWPGVPVGHDEARLIAGAIGSKRAVLLAHHGLVVAGRSVEEACLLALQFERAAALQLLAMSAGKLRRIRPEMGHEAHDWALDPAKVRASFHAFARRALRASPDLLETVP